MPISAGTRLGPYEISAPIGAGGMGEVFRARDTRLERIVAIKVLQPHLSADAQLRERFDREARTISSLSHPHICALYDIGRQDGVDFLVMEYLEGESLADRISRGALPMDQVLRYGSQIAAALDRAHRSGIVHRDLKPGNVMLTKSGAKLLDFGLAGLTLPPVSGDAPTEQQKPLTQEGMILGTFQYMAPEQLDGRKADARTDIFALGCVLYEMATGQRAFQGKTKASLIAAIVDRNPVPISQLQPVTPPAFEHVVDRCLRKEPDERWQSAHDIGEELKWIEGGVGETAPAKVAGRWKWLPWVIAAAGITTTAILGALYLNDRGSASAPIRFSIPAPSNFDFDGGFAVSPSGDAICFIADPHDSDERSLWIRRLDDPEPKLLARGNNARHVFWSPDGEWIAYFADRKLWKVAASGGSPQMISHANYGVGGSWSSKGTIIFSPEFGTGIFQVSAAGGEPRAVTTLDAGRRESIHAWPIFLPDGERFFFVVRTTASESNRIMLGSLAGGTSRFVMNSDALSGYIEPDLYFVRNGTLFAQEVDLDDARMIGEPRRVVDEVAFFEAYAAGGASLSPGTIVSMPPPRIPMNLRWRDRSGAVQEIVTSDETFEKVRVSHDGRKLVYERLDPVKGGSDIWVTDRVRGARSRLTGGRADHQRAAWSPDDSQLAFTSDQAGLYDIYVQPADAASPARAIWISAIDKWVNDWSPDGKHLLITATDLKTREDLWLVPLESEKPIPILRSEYAEDEARFSPDGRFIAYTSDRSGSQEIYVRHLASGKTEQVSVAGGLKAEWSRDGNEIFFITNQKKVMAVRLRFEGNSIHPSTPVELFQLGALEFDDFAVGADGRFLVRSVPDLARASGSLNVIHHPR